jgi:hypothetical protein
MSKRRRYRNRGKRKQAARLRRDDPFGIFTGDCSWMLAKPGDCGLFGEWTNLVPPMIRLPASVFHDLIENDRYLCALTDADPLQSVWDNESDAEAFDN